MSGRVFLLVAVLGVLSDQIVAEVTPLGSEFQVNTYTADFQAYPSAASDAQGNFVVVWSSYGQDFSYGGIFAQRYANDGTPRGTEFQVNSSAYEDQYFPAVASDSAGNFVVVWSSYGYDGDLTGVFGQRFDSDGNSVGGEFQVNTETIGYQGLPAVASAPDGRFVVVWASEDQDGSDFGVFGQRYDASGTAAGPEFQVNSTTQDYQGDPAIASDAGGGFVVVWTSYAGNGYGYDVFGQRFDASGQPVNAEFRVNSHIEDDQISPAVAETGAGNFVVVWQSDVQDGSGTGIFGQRFNSAGSPEGSEFLVPVTTVGDQAIPAVGVDAGGDFVVTWVDNQRDGSRLGVFGRRFDATGNPLTGDFQVNSTTADDQTYPTVAVSNSGQFVVAWSSYAQDGDGFGVFAQRFSAGLPACPGDCDGDGSVFVAELIRGVNIALGNTGIEQCAAFDTNNDGSVAVNELIQGVNAALSGCPS